MRCAQRQDDRIAGSLDRGCVAPAVEVHPDDYYERLYERRLREQLAPERRRLYTDALARALAARYTAVSRDVPIAR